MAKKKKRKKSGTRTALKRTPTKAAAKKKVARKKKSAVPVDPVNGTFVIAKGDAVLELNEMGEHRFSDTAPFSDVLQYHSRVAAQELLKSYPEDESLKEASVVPAKTIFAADYDFDLDEQKCLVTAVRSNGDPVTSYKLALKGALAAYKEQMRGAKDEVSRLTKEIGSVMKDITLIEKQLRTFKEKFVHV